LPFIFVRLFTADGVDSLKKSAALALPLSLVFCSALLVFGMLASVLPDVAKGPDQVWFLVSYDAGGLVVLGLAGVVLLAASMGFTDGAIQATGAQIANDLVGNYLNLEYKQQIVVAKLGMAILTLMSAWLATVHLPALFSLAVLGYQGVIQLAVPQFGGIFWKRGNKYGAIGGMSVGFATAMTLELTYPAYVPWAFGLSSGMIALAVNLGIYVACGFLVPVSASEKARVERLFQLVLDEKKVTNDESTVASAGLAML
jgi:SSS family solute:Na+ symporter